MQRLLDEGQVIIFAGTETSARALSVGMYYLLNDKSLIEKMREELKQVAHIPDEELTAQKLEPLPYLVSHLHLIPDLLFANSQILDWCRKRVHPSLLRTSHPSSPRLHEGDSAIQELLHSTKGKSPKQDAQNS